MTRDKDHRKLGKEQQLLEAARLGQLKQLESILVELQIRSKKRSNPLASLRKSVGPNSVRDPVTGFTCLHHSALNGHTQCVQLILDYGAKINAVDYKGSSALHLASWAGNLQVVKILLGYSATSTSLLVGAAAAAAAATATSAELSGSPQHFQEIDINLRNNDNQTPLSLAAQFGHNEVVSELLAHSASVYLRNNQLESPLDLACLNGRLETVRLLLASSADLVADLRRPQSTIRLATNNDEPSNYGNTTTKATHSHQRRPSGSGWSSLLRSKSRDHSQSSPTKSSPTGADTSSVRNRRATLAGDQYLDEAQCSFGERLLGHSPLHCAVRRGHLHVVRLLLSSPFRANVMQVTSLGSVLHEVAVQNGCGQSTSLLSSSSRYAGELRELIGLLMSQLVEQQPADRLKRRQVVESFLNLTNSQRKNVFEVLGELNNRSAQEIRHLINEISTVVVEQQQQQHHPQQQTMQVAAMQPNRTFNDAQLVQTSQRQQPFFSDNQQINSFVTMKRLPKQRPTNHLLKADDGAATSNHRLQLQFNQQRADEQLSALGTQTIDRRNRPGFGRQPATCQPSSWQAQPAVGGQAGNSFTRSVSDLVEADQARVSSTPNDDQQASLLWRQWLAQGLSNADQLASFQDKLDRQRHETHLAGQHKRRSKSRDLGSLLLEAQQQQQQVALAATNNEQLYDNETYESRLQANGNQLQQQQHPLVRSQTDCSHLMGRFFGDQTAPTHAFNQQLSRNTDQNANKQQQVDRKAINRHYHVYEHEFYPPRLINQTVAAVAVVPPMNRSESTGGGGGSLRSPNSYRATIHRSQQGAELRPAEQVDSRLSLNLDSSQQVRVEETQANQQQQMDRFLGRHSRKVLAPQPVDAQQQQHLMDMQRNLIAQQQQQLRESHSLESHLGEAHLFESTRRALMHDFDQMIGRELLNQDYRQQLETLVNGQQSNRLSSSIGSQNSILTGVSLDMDTRGECLTVSGTRITMSPADDPQNHHHHQQHQQLSRSMSARQPASEASLVRAAQVTPVDGRQVGHIAPAAPQRPPRPLQRDLSQPRGQAERPTSSASSSSVIYDLPVGERRSASRSSNGVQVAAPTAMSELAKQSRCKSTGGQRGPARPTEPPQERPPPPPAGSSAFLAVNKLASVGVSSPLKLSTQQLDESRSSPGVALPSPASSLQQHNLDQATGSLLKMGSISSSSSSSSSATTRGATTFVASTMSNGGHHSHHHLATDGDSGICTSNSPSSMSHDSEKPPNEQRGKAQQAEVAEEAPPSPETAQLCIEEALQPLEQNTHQAANQTSPQFTRSRSTDHLNEVVVDWLGATDNHKQEPQVARYENCLSLQQQLQSKRNQTQSIDNLFDDLLRSSSKCHSNLMVSCKRGPSLSSSSSCSLSSRRQPVEQIDDDDDDYAATSEHENSSSLGSFSFLSGNEKNKKEILLKVVVDERQQSIDGNEVFYIKPSELKKISSASNTNGTGTQTAEAETLTDEELCASVDKDSGFIKFTLRKRRGEHELYGADQSAIIECDNNKQVDVVSSNSQSSEEILETKTITGDCLLTKQASSDSNEIDSSQASSSTTTTTSSSIRSIVALKRPTDSQSSGLATRPEEIPSAPQDREPQVGSIVSETARRLEEAAAAKLQQTKPVAAVRKSQAGQVRPVVAPKRPEEQGEVITTSSGRVNDLRQQLEQSTTIKRQPLKKNICWPPPKADQIEVSSTDNSPNQADKKPDDHRQEEDPQKSPIEMLPVLGRVSTNRLSFQRLIEEKNRQCQKQLPPPTRPKPAPPVKPAILVASRFNNIGVSHKS